MSGDGGEGEREGGWRGAIDARLVDACERHGRGAARLRREPTLRTWLRTPRTHLDPADWRAGYLEVREREIPFELQEDLHQLMPQALLRDLYRPAYEERWVARELIEGTGDRAGLGALAEARRARVRPPLPRIEPAVRAVREHQAWRRALYAERWQPVLADDEPRRPVPI